MKNNSKVLFVSYFFPPIGGGGVIRTLKFTKYLPQFGWRPLVLTVKESFYPIYDKSLLEELPPEVEINRVNYFEPATWIKKNFWQSLLSYIIYPFFLIPDRQILWFLPALKRAGEIIEKENIKIIYTSSAPNSDHLIGYFLKKHHRIKWVADFRDEWTNNPLRRFPTPIHRWLNQYWEKKVVKSADRVISVSGPITRYLSSICPDKKKFFTITNGFDRPDFEGAKPKKDKKRFTIMFSGSIYNTKIIEPFLQAIKEIDLKDLKVEFVGIKKRVPHKEAVKLLFRADVLLLILAAVPRPGVLTGKLFEYLAAKKPILALIPENTEAAKLIKKFKVGEIVSPLDKENIIVVIKKMYKLWQKKKLKVSEINIDEYSRENLTKKLATIFDHINKRERKIKLCLIGNIQSPQNQNLVNFFKNIHYDVYFISTRPPSLCSGVSGRAKPGNIAGIENYYLGPITANPCSTACYFLRSLLRIRRLFKKIKPDIVHGQDLVFGGIWAYLTGFHPLVTTAWGSDVMNYEKFIRLEQYLIRKTLKKADLVTFASKALLDKAKKIGMPEEKAQLVHFGVDLDIFKKQNVENLRSKLKIKNEKIIFCPRSIAPIYNTDILIEALAKLNRTRKFKLILVNQNANENYLIKIEKLIIKYNLVDDVVFLPKLQPKEMAKYYNLADVVVSISSSDGCSVSFLEAMASECKIVATNLPYIKEWFSKNNIWLVPVSNVEKTSPALLEASKFPKFQWQKIGEANRQQIAQKAEINNNFEKLDELYRGLIE